MSCKELGIPNTVSWTGYIEASGELNRLWLAPCSPFFSPLILWVWGRAFFFFQLLLVVLTKPARFRHCWVRLSHIEVPMQAEESLGARTKADQVSFPVFFKPQHHPGPPVSYQLPWQSQTGPGGARLDCEKKKAPQNFVLMPRAELVQLRALSWASFLHQALKSQGPRRIRKGTKRDHTWAWVLPQGSAFKFFLASLWVLPPGITG